MRFTIRNAGQDDAEQIVELIADLGHEMTVEAVRERIESLYPQIVAVRDERLLGLCGLHVMTAIHRPYKVGRITILVVAPDLRGQGIGRALVEAAEQRLRDAECGLIEVTSNERLTEAHDFYQRLGYEHTSKRFAKPL